MVSSLPISILVGTVLGFLTGLGTGGGSLLVLWLTLVLGMPDQVARTVNLMFFIPAAVVSSVLRCRKGGIPYKKIWLPTLGGCVSAAILASVGSHMNMDGLRKLFGILLIFTGIRELCYRKS